MLLGEHSRSHDASSSRPSITLLLERQSKQAAIPFHSRHITAISSPWARIDSQFTCLPTIPFCFNSRGNPLPEQQLLYRFSTNESYVVNAQEELVEVINFSLTDQTCPNSREPVSDASNGNARPVFFRFPKFRTDASSPVCSVITSVRNAGPVFVHRSRAHIRSPSNDGMSSSSPSVIMLIRVRVVDRSVGFRRRQRIER
jgi:hypothetical protein